MTIHSATIKRNINPKLKETLTPKCAWTHGELVIEKINTYSLICGALSI